MQYSAVQFSSKVVKQWFICTAAFSQAYHIVYRPLAIFFFTYAPLQLILMRQEAQRKPKHVPKRPQCFFQRASVTKCRVHITQPDDLQPCISICHHTTVFITLQQCWLLSVLTVSSRKMKKDLEWHSPQSSVTLTLQSTPLLP